MSMPRGIRIALRLLAVAALAAALPALLPTSPATDGPYLSGLSDLAAAPAFAAPTCNNKSCGQAPIGLKFKCVDSTAGTNCKLVRGGSDCAITSC